MAFAIKNKKKSREDIEMYVVEKDISKFENEEAEFAHPYKVLNKPDKVSDVEEDIHGVETEVYEVAKDRKINDREHQSTEPQPWETRIVAEPRKERLSLAQKLPKIKEPRKPGIVKSIEKGTSKVSSKTKQEIIRKYKTSDYYARLKAQKAVEKEARDAKFKKMSEDEKLNINLKKGKFKTPTEKVEATKSILKNEGIDYVQPKKKKKRKVDSKVTVDDKNETVTVENY